MSAEQNTPWRVVLGDKWPFHISVLDSEDREVLYEIRHAYATGQKSLEDVMSGCFMGYGTEIAVRENAAQMARIKAIVRAVNRDALFDEMVEALKAVQALISEGAATGFNYKDGDWAEKLFFSQRATSAVLAKVREASK